MYNLLVKKTDGRKHHSVLICMGERWTASHIMDRGREWYIKHVNQCHATLNVIQFSVIKHN
jgi:hypothetical protein